MNYYIRAFESYRITGCECMHSAIYGWSLFVTWQRWLSH